MKKSFYVAAPLGEHRIAQSIAAKLRLVGHDVCSTWHEQAFLADPLDIKQKGVVWNGNKAELRQATHLVIFTDRGIPRATYTELGYFLALCEESHDRGGVYWLSGEPSAGPVPVGDSLVTHCASVVEFLEAVSQ